ncbi:MAG: transposase [Candidatus Nanoarchaeia archaeon]
MQTALYNQYNNKLEEQLINLFHSADLPLHSNKTGYKDFTNYQRLSLIIIFRRENKSIRDFLEWLNESKWISWLDLKRIPKKSTFHDWLKMFDMRLIRKLINLSVDKTDLKVVAIDGSGVDTNFKSSYYKKRLKDFGQRTSNSYHKLDILVDTYRKKQIINYSFLIKNRQDSFVGKKLLKQIKFKRCKILADKGYPDYDFADTAKLKQNNFVSPPKDYGEKCKHNNFKRRRKIKNFESNKKIYGRRVIVECVFSSLKRKQHLMLRSKLSYMKKREMGWHVLFYNIRRNIIFYEVDGNKNLAFYFLELEIYLIPDKADF